MRKGDIVLVPFPFSDLKGTKNRPALILIASQGITLSFITSKTHPENKFDVKLTASSENGLKKNSLLRLSKLATLDRDLVIGRLGTISSTEVRIVNENLIKLFKLAPVP